MSEMTMSQFQDELDELRDLLIAKNRAVREQKAATKAYKQQMTRVRELMEHWHISSHKTDRGGYEAPQATWYATVQDFDTFKNWADATGIEGAYDYSHRASAAMNRLVQEAIDNGRPLPPGLGAYPKAPVRVKGVREEELKDDD